MSRSTADFVRLLNRLARQQLGLVSRAQLLARGVSPDVIKRIVRARQLEPVLSGVYRVPGSPRSWEQDQLATIMWADPAAASHRAAGRILGISVFEDAGPEITTTRRLSDTCNAAVHRVPVLDREDVFIKGPFLVTTPARTIFDLGGVCPEEVVEQALEEALHTRLTTLAAVRWQLRRSGQRGRNGSAALRRILDDLSEDHVPTASALELKVDRLLRTLCLPPYRRQYEVVIAGRRRRPDFAFVEYKVAVEAHSFKWHHRRRTWEEDQIRDRAFRTDGWDVIYVT